MSTPTLVRSFAQLALDRTALRPALRPAAGRAPTAAFFSTSAPRYASIVKKKTNMTAAPKKAVKTLNVKKGRKDGAKDSGKGPAPGERRALRKRIVLSNNNALEVAGLQDLDYASVLSPDLEGAVCGIPEDAVDALRAVDAFKPRQGWSMFRRPAVLVRRQTAQLAQLMAAVEEAGGSGAEAKTVRRVLAGPRMSGKSTLVLQALMMANLREWVVVNLPDAQDIVNAHTAYAPLPGSVPLQYTQDTYTQTLLGQILKANKKFFEPEDAKYTPLLTTSPSLPVPLPATASLKQLIDIGIVDADAAWPVFVALWKELTQPGRPPIMLALDGLSHIMRNSDYLNAQVKPIHAHDLTIVRHFVDHLSGSTPLPNGGMVLAATTGSNSPGNQALDFCLKAAEARQAAPESVPIWNPYRKADVRTLECLKDIEVIKVAGLSKDEARSIMEYYAESGMLRARIDDPYVSEKWSLAGMGNIGELERTTIRMRV